ncbi:hypothetical protein GBF38_001162 [Nibea albiflora]|uniref:Uncharacterized protein n=1 Tax=Nibea albiflora TaxID=240163 RepID=A0ACB7ETL1_NIBAL|nr:hypothetical protein GBF38_001162 [Nibea albiflora]
MKRGRRMESPSPGLEIRLVKLGGVSHLINQKQDEDEETGGYITCSLSSSSGMTRVSLPVRATGLKHYPGAAGGPANKLS